MPLLRYDEMVPEVYVEQSRDFQLLTRLWAIALNNSKYFADKLKYQNDPENVESSLLLLLQRKVGFFSSKEFTDAEMRGVCKVFYALTRNKGSLLALTEMIRLFFVTQNLQTSAFINTTTKVTQEINIDNKQYKILDSNKSYIVEILIDDVAKDVTLLQELISYIIPTGWKTVIGFYKSSEVDMKLHTLSDVQYITDKDIGKLYTHNTPNTSRYLLGAVDTTSIYKTYIVKSEG